MSDCLFCKIIDKKIPAPVVYEDEKVLAFNDINPQAPIHILVIPKEHIERILDIDLYSVPIVGEMILCANKLARTKKIDQAGYRIVMNCNAGAGQSVYHIHLHLLGGRIMQWPPG